MDSKYPPGFAWHSNNNGKILLLPQKIVRDLSQNSEQKIKEKEHAIHKVQIMEIIENIIEEHALTLTELHAQLIDFSWQPKKITEFKLKPSNDKYIQVFDMNAINDQKKNRYTMKGALSVLKKFADSDTGERVLKDVPMDFIKQLQILKTQYPNFMGFLEYVESFAALALRQRYPAFYFPPVLLIGVPGIGKTAVVNAVAKLVGVATRQVDFASTTAGFVLAGLSSQWSDAKTGIIADVLRDNNAANPIIIGDEIDKVSQHAKHDPLGPMYSLLESTTAARFIDEALDIPIDASHVIYVATANSLKTIPKPILSRFIVLEVHPISLEQHAAVTQSIYQSLLQQHACIKVFSKRLSIDVINALQDRSPREIKATLRRALAQSALRAPKKAKKLNVLVNDLLFSEIDSLSPRSYNGNDSFGFLH